VADVREALRSGEDHVVVVAGGEVVREEYLQACIIPDLAVAVALLGRGHVTGSDLGVHGHVQRLGVHDHTHARGVGGWPHALADRVEDRRPLGRLPAGVIQRAVDGGGCVSGQTHILGDVLRGGGHDERECHEADGGTHRLQLPASV
jgi:hypothetical protein